jgi:hypothetical protein
MLPIIKWFYPKMIPSYESAVFLPIPDAISEHSPQVLNGIIAQFAMKPQNDLCITGSAKFLPAQKSIAKLLEIVDFAIINDNKTTIVTIERLISSIRCV